jgi:hypothetical protein
MLSVNFLSSIQNFSFDLQKDIQKSLDKFDIVNNILHQPIGTIVKKNGSQQVVQPWTQQVLDAKVKKFELINKIGLALIVAFAISCIAAPILVAFGVAFGYAIIPLGIAFISIFSLALVAITIEEQFQLQTIYHFQNSWANPADFNIASVRRFRPYFAVGTQAEQYANLVTSIQLLRNRQSENVEIYAKMLLGHQISTLQLVNPRSATLLKFFKAKAVLNQIPFIKAHRTVNLNGIIFDIDAAIAAGH